MIDYTKGKVYKIISNVEGCIPYIGSTCEKYLANRLSGHFSGYKRWKESKSNKMMSYSIFDKYGVDACKIVLIEQCNVTTKDALNQREQFYIDSMDCINKRKAFVREDEKEQLRLEVCQRYREANKDKINQFYADNAAALKAKAKIYHEANKDVVNAKRREKVLCEVCNVEMNKGTLERHKKTSKHLLKVAVYP